MSAAPLPVPADELRSRLLAWYAEHGRDLPFRARRDPYAIWTSEVMAQQTTIVAVLGYWERFMAAFPTVEDLAAAPIDDVLALWSGLGYYRRARNLHQAAIDIASRGGGFPETIETLRSLPGVGPYTAAAIGSICFSIPEPVIDGNVVRVLSRLGRIDDDPARRAGRSRIENLARELLDEKRPGDFNQALMELGSLVCTPRRPCCGACPLAAGCLARAAGDPLSYPALAPRAASVPLVVVPCVLSPPDGGFVLRRIPPDERNGGLWELPSVVIHDGGAVKTEALPRALDSTSIDRVRRELRSRFRLEVPNLVPAGRVRHGITRYRILALVAAGCVDRPEPSKELRVASPADLAAAGVTALTRKVVENGSI